MAQPNILELAKQGNAKAIANLINRSLQPKGITAKVTLKDGCLQVMLESDQVPEELALVSFIRKSMTSLGAKSIERLKVYGWQTGEEFPAWEQEFELGTQVKSKAVQGNQSLDLPSQPGLSALPQQKPVTKVVANRTYALTGKTNYAV